MGRLPNHSNWQNLSVRMQVETTRYHNVYFGMLQTYFHNIWYI